MPRFSLASLTAIVVLAAAIADPLAGQRPSSWVELERSGGVDPFAVTQLGKLAVYRETGDLWVFSAFTRQWHHRAVSAAAAIRQSNDWVLIQEGNQFTAFSSIRGTFETVGLSGSAFVVNPSNQRNDSILLVRDGSDLWAFSGFVGQWVRRTLAGGVTQIATQRHVAVVASGTQLAAMSAYSGVWIPESTLLPVTQVRADGSIGIAETATSSWCFSAQREAWESAVAPAGAVFVQDDDVAVWCDSTRCLAFSGPRGEFASVSLAGGGAPQLDLDQSLAVATVGTVAHLYSAATGHWTVFDARAGFSVTTSATTALLEEPGEIHAYSALRDHVATLPISPAATEVNWTVAAAQQSATNLVFVFSAFTGEWVFVADAASFPRTAFNGALIRTAGGGFTAFSTRTGELVPLPSPAPGAFEHVQLRSGVLAVEDSQSLHVFEPRRRVWISQPVGPGGLNVVLWRTSLLAFQGNRAFGYGTQTGEIEAHDLPESVRTTRASSESASLATSTFVIGFSAVPDLTTLWQFPEFRRLYGRGSRLTLKLRGPAGANATAVVGLPVRADLPTIAGPILLNPATMGIVWSGVVPVDGVVSTGFVVPDAAVLSGLNLGFQGAIVPPAGPGYFTRLGGLYLP